MSAPLIQNFSIPADNDLTIQINVTPLASMDTLVGSMVFWNVYEQQYGVPTPDVAPVISKNSLSGDGGIAIPDSPADLMEAIVTIASSDTVGLLRNYFHETTVVDVEGHTTSVNQGILTITPTENRP